MKPNLKLYVSDQTDPPPLGRRVSARTIDGVLTGVVTGRSLALAGGHVGLSEHCFDLRLPCGRLILNVPVSALVSP